MKELAICKEIQARLEKEHIRRFKGVSYPLLLISTQYAGLWLEHVYDSVFYAKLDPTKRYLAENAVNVFLDNQTEDGQIPYAIWDKNSEEKCGYSQIQECVSLAKLCLEVYKLNVDRKFLLKCYTACAKWVAWLQRNRMTRKMGLIEMFVGFDTGHDNSGRLENMSCKGNYVVNGERQNAAVLPPDEVAPILAVDMNCNFYGTLKALAQMADILENGEVAQWETHAAMLKKRLFEVCYDTEDAFFYDVDKHGNPRKCLSSTIFHLFLEGVLDKTEDKAIIDEIYSRHIKNPNEFWTAYPFPSVAVNDPSCQNHAACNCWGYYAQALIALRCTLWMDDYGYSTDFDVLCERWLASFTKHYEEFPLGQEIDPITGKPTGCSPWYSSAMLFYLYAAKRLGKLTENIFCVP